MKRFLLIMMKDQPYTLWFCSQSVDLINKRSGWPFWETISFRVAKSKCVGQEDLRTGYRLRVGDCMSFKDHFGAPLHKRTDLMKCSAYTKEFVRVCKLWRRRRKKIINWQTALFFCFPAIGFWGLNWLRRFWHLMVNKPIPRSVSLLLHKRLSFESLECSLFILLLSL